MGNELVPFQYEGKQVRTKIVDGVPWFVVMDVCAILDIDNPTQAVSKLDTDEKNTLILNEGNRGNPCRVTVNSSGLYALILRSDKPEARRFRKFVTSEVIPAIHKHGRYDPVEAKYSDILEKDQDVAKMEFFLKVAREQAIERHEREVQGRQITLLAQSVQAIEAKVDQAFGDNGFSSIMCFCSRYRIKINQEQAKRVGVALSAYCSENGIEIGEKVKNGNFWVNAYPDHVLDFWRAGEIPVKNLIINNNTIYEATNQ